MKKLFIILGMILLCSCNDNVVLDLEQRADATTVALQRVAQADTTTYHVVFNDRELIVLDDEYMVIAKGEKQYDQLTRVCICLAFLLLGIIFGFKIKKV